MTFGRVIGKVWATVKAPGLQGARMLVVQPLTPELAPTGRRIVCTDCTGAGAGELVYWVRGKEASFPFLPTETPTDTTIVGIVDSVHVARSGEDDRSSSSANSQPRSTDLSVGAGQLVRAKPDARPDRSQSRARSKRC
jgi:ethanolamine utilization protein EutN